MIQKPVNVNLPAIGDTPVAITLLEDQESADWVVQVRGNIDMIISNEVTMDTFWTVKAGTAISINESIGSQGGLFYAVSGAAGSVVEVLPLRRHRNR